MFGDVSVDLNPGLNVIVGENNSGKTGIIDAIRLVLDTTSAEWTRISEDDFHRDSTRFHIRLRFDQIQPEQSHVFVEHLSYEAEEGRGRKPVLYVNLTATLTDSMRRRNRYIRTELRSGHDAEGPAIEREIRDYLSATYLRPLRDAEAELSAGRRSRLAQILSSSDALREQKNFEKLLTDFIKANLNAKNNPGVSATQRSILNHFQKMTFADDDKKFAVAVQILGSKAFSEMSDPEKQRAFQDILSRLSLVLDESRPQQGLGYNNVLFMATELILLEQEANQCPILLIEEPEAHLHPQLQMKFLKFVRDEFSRGSTPTLQTILTSHSPNLASKAPLDSLIVMKDGKAFPMRKGSTKLNYDDYDFLEKFLDVTKANLFFAKAVLIVEGDAENILLPTIAALLGRPLEDYGISIVNVGGTAYARYAKIFPRPGVDERPWEWLPIKVACLRDLDLWPEAADKDARPDVGFISVSDRNKGYWERRKGKDGPFGTDPNEKRKKLERFLKMEDEETDFEPQNVGHFDKCGCVAASRPLSNLGCP
jgi:putative ATP-dependent endonuclease of OLD family